MPASKECPMCGAAMRFREKEEVIRVPGNPYSITRKAREWLCRNCDYFEEADEEP